MENNLHKEFVPYEEALKLKALGLDEPCVAYWDDDKVFELNPEFLKGSEMDSTWLTAPTFSQAFRWFREKYRLYHSIGLDSSTEEDVNCDFNIINHDQSISELETDFKNYEEAELACLKRLIKIANELE